MNSCVELMSRKDSELEDAVQEALINKLLSIGWTVEPTGFTEVYRQGSRKKLLEWDGIFIASSDALHKRLLIVIETKQIFTAEKFENFKERLVKMQKAMISAEVDDDLWPFKNVPLCGVIASPVIRGDVNVSEYTHVTVKQDQFDVMLDSNLFAC